MKRLGILISIILFYMATSCKKEVEILDKDASYQYFPNKEGTFIIYHIDSLYYNQFTNSIDTFSYDLKEKIIELFTDAGGRKSQRIQRYIKVNNTWQIVRVWKAFVNNKQAEKTEENITYIKLVFPLSKNLKWRGNALNTIDTLTPTYYTCTHFNEPFSNKKLSFDSCATVLQYSDSTLITKKEATEIYALNVGMVYKRIINLKDNTSQIDATKPISKRANSGTDVIIYAIGVGVE